MPRLRSSIHDLLGSCGAAGITPPWWTTSLGFVTFLVRCGTLPVIQWRGCWERRLQRRDTNFRLSVRFGGVPRQLKTNALKAENRPPWECTPIKRMRQVRLRSENEVVSSTRPPPLGFISRHRPKLGKLSSRHLLSVSALHSSGSFRDKMLPNFVARSIGLQITGSAKSQKSSYKRVWLDGLGQPRQTAHSGGRPAL